MSYRCAHRVTYTSPRSCGIHVARVIGAPDQDMAAMFVNSHDGCKVQSIIAVQADSAHVWGEQRWSYEVPA